MPVDQYARLTKFPSTTNAAGPHWVSPKARTLCLKDFTPGIDSQNKALNEVRTSDQITSRVRMFPSVTCGSSVSRHMSRILKNASFKDFSIGTILPERGAAFKDQSSRVPLEPHQHPGNRASSAIPTLLNHPKHLALVGRLANQLLVGRLDLLGARVDELPLRVCDAGYRARRA